MNEVTFYHGTRAGFQGRGGLLTPRVRHGGKSTHAPLKEGYSEREDAAKYVYLTTSLELAWVYAWHAPGRGNPKVLTVRPLAPVYRDPEHSEDMQAYRTESAVVLSVDTDPIMDEWTASAGWVHE